MSNPPPPSSTSSSSKITKKQKQPKQDTPPAHINPNPAPEVGNVPEMKIVNGEERQRGPVEEVIAKRMRQLGKKLMRYRTYAQQPSESLNADQRATVANLPSLEGAYKELEDLIREKGPIDEQELIQAAKLREATQAARAVAVAEASTSLDQYKESLVTPLSLFLKLHTILHPARPTDHQHLTFGHLTLPPHLQDEVQATDVLRVGRMWEDLISGGTEAQAVLDGLVAGPKGDDEENDHIHHLLDLLSRPEPASTTGDADAQPVVETAPASRAESINEVADDATPATLESAPQSEFGGIPNGHEASTPQPEPAQTQTINFLQDDELEVKDAEQSSTKGIEDDYEVVPMLEPHQTSGDQQPVSDQRTYTPPSLDTPPPVPAQTAPSSFAPATSLNWADLDDEDELPASMQPAPVDVATEEVDPDNQQPVIAIVQQNELAGEESLSSPITEAPTAVESSPSAPSAPNPKSVPTGPSRGKGGRKHSQRQPRAVEPPQPAGKVVVDEDGFEMKVRRAPVPPSRGGRGRGGANGDVRGGRGRGGGSGRGRGGGNGQQGRSASVAGPQLQQKKGEQAQAQGQPKPSIFKTVQPNGPKSAPVLS